MKLFLFILNAAGEPEPTEDLAAYGLMLMSTDRNVAANRIGDAHVVTSFIGVDPSCQGRIWETMVFGGDLDDSQDRCAGSREQAQAMHARMLEKVRAAMTPK